MATDWQHQNRKRPNSASNDQPLKVGLTCSFVDFHLRQIVVFWLSGGGSASSNLAGGARQNAALTRGNAHADRIRAKGSYSARPHRGRKNPKSGSFQGPNPSQLASVVVSGPGPQRMAARGTHQLAPTTSRHPSHRRPHPADPGTGACTGRASSRPTCGPSSAAPRLISAPDAIASEAAVCI